MTNPIQLTALLTLLLAGRVTLCAQNTPSPLKARAAQFQLNTPYKATPGDALSHHTAGYAKVMCLTVLIKGLKPDFAAEKVVISSAHYSLYLFGQENRSKLLR